MRIPNVFLLAKLDSRLRGNDRSVVKAGRHFRASGNLEN